MERLDRYCPHVTGRILITIYWAAIFTLLPAELFSQSPTSVEKDMIAALKLIADSGSYSGNYDEEKNDKANTELRSLLTSHGDRQEILQYSFPKLKEEMGVATSPDGKFRIYSWDLQTGGTMHDYDCVFQYYGSLRGRPIAKPYAERGDMDAGSFYSRIAQVDMPLGRLYLANSTFIGDGMTHGQSIEIFGVSGDGLGSPKFIRTTKGLTNMVSFSYSPFTIKDRVDEDGLVTFATDGRWFRFPVVINDKDSGAGRITNRFITYRFNGTHFVKVR